uniref:Ubiquitin-like domain-containing protein n=1 Tax=Panagrolaimus sp. JU765 TaxID=591449 RepID=A0AC34QSS0_9BILA
MGNLYFEIQRKKLHFFCDYSEDSTPKRIKEDLEKFLGISQTKQILKLQTSTDPDNLLWIILDDTKTFVEQGCTNRIAKADTPAVVALIIKNEDDDIVIERMSSPPPIPEQMRQRDNSNDD